MTSPVLKEIKIECIDEDESPCSDLMLPPYRTDSPDAVNSYDFTFEVLKKDLSEEESPESGYSLTNKLVVEFPPNHSDLPDHVNSCNNKFGVLKQPKKDFSEEEDNHESVYDCKNKKDLKQKKHSTTAPETTTLNVEVYSPVLKDVKVERIDDEESPCSDLMFRPYRTDSPDAVNSYDCAFEVLKKDLSEEESPESGYSSKNQIVFEDDKKLLKLIDKKDIKSEYEEHEELCLSVNVREGDRKYQGKRKTERSNDQELLDKIRNSSIHYDVLVATEGGRCKFCGEIFNSRFNLLKHNIEHLKLDINTPEVIKKYQRQLRKSEKSRTPRRTYNKRGVHKTKLLYHCKYCNKQYKYGSWKKHLEICHSEKKYKCGLCKRKFRCFYYVENHMKMVHIVQMYRQSQEYGRMYNCWCGKQFRSLVYLNNHKRERHNMHGHSYTPINVNFL